METARLRVIQQPSRVEALLDSFFWSREFIPNDARRIRERTDLPGALQRVAMRVQKQEHAWGAWTDDHRLWFYTAEMSLALSRERGQPVLQINAYNEDGQLEESGMWVCTRDEKWHRCVA